jgi:DNA-directed RNA polymerase subunit beta'
LITFNGRGTVLCIDGFDKKSPCGFEAFRNREIATGGDAIRKQLTNLDLQIIMNCAYTEWIKLAEQESTGNEWED